MRGVPKAALEILESLILPDNAADAVAEIERHMLDSGYRTAREVDVRYGMSQNSPRGRVDLMVVDNDDVFLIEVDRRTPRRKSIEKIRYSLFDGAVVVRRPMDGAPRVVVVESVEL